MQVLDTTALLHWPVDRLSGGRCAFSQRAELEALAPARRMLVESAELDWREPSPMALEKARLAGAESGDLPRLSPVDLDVLALALEGPYELVTDDYRLQNAARTAGLVVHALATTGAREVWSWVWRCVGCRKEHPVESNHEPSRRGNGPECGHCGSHTEMKRQRR